MNHDSVEPYTASYNDDSIDLVHPGDISIKRELENEERDSLARKETLAVRYVRTILLFVLLLATVTSSVLSFVYNRNNEINAFQAHFSASARKVIQSFHGSFERKLAAADALSIAMTSNALSTRSSFPNVTLPHFEVRGSNSRIMSDSIAMYWLPVVTDETRNGWETYSMANVKYLQKQAEEEAKLREMQDEQFFGHRKMQNRNDDFSKQIFRYNDAYLHDRVIEKKGSGPYLPLWQTSPALPTQSAINFNMLSSPFLSEDLLAVLYSEKVVMSKAVELSDVTKEWNHLNATSRTPNLYGYFFQAGQYRHHAEKYTAGPTTNLLYPVFNQFGPQKQLAGILVFSIFWSLYFTDILPVNTNGVICVLENSKNQTYTYQIDGSHVTFLGKGDLHNSKYDHLKAWVDVKARIQEDMGPENWSFTAAELFADYCRYNLRIYPSHAMEDVFITNQPIFFSLVVAAIFCFTSLLFIGYDCLVARRQTIVLDRAAAAGAMVSSLYPQSVHDRLYADSSSTPSSSRTSAGMRSSVSPVSLPIADHFTATTIMFGDLAGFTQWSANRKPEEVFALLENLYSAFDRLAIRWKVFKVETIGDCYVAVTGLPDPQEDHAVRIAKFANLCMVQMNKVTNHLMDTLGNETGNLMMRIGLHSGPVTAGVLRGQKSRFQLFGDTMNTASRMESNGEKGRIHVSQETADEIIAGGKKDWITPREDKIVVKGKGEMQTFWLNINVRTSTSTTSSSTNESSSGSEL